MLFSLRKWIVFINAYTILKIWYIFLEIRWSHSPIRNWISKSFALLRSAYTSWKLIQNGIKLLLQLSHILTRPETASFQSRSWHRFAHSLQDHTPACSVTFVLKQSYEKNNPLNFLWYCLQEMNLGPSTYSLMNDWIRKSDGKLSLFGYTKFLHGVTIRSSNSRHRQLPWLKREILSLLLL